MSRKESEKKCRIPKAMNCSLKKMYVNKVMKNDIIQRKIEYFRYFL
jgi:hypothetical protein